MRSVFLIVLLTSCQLLEKPPAITIVEHDDKAIGIDIPGQLLRGLDRSRMRVELAKEGDRTAVLGEFIEAGDDLRFLSAVPLTLGFTYEVYAGEKMIGMVQVPESKEPPPTLVAVYPLQDTLPENLLKFYFQFSVPMREGLSASGIWLTNVAGDTLKGTFLDLQPELWNEDATVLTLWLDPGRIKLDLIPNQEYGNPLKTGETYVLHVSSTMESKKRKNMTDDFSKTFFVSARDDHSPKPDAWKIRVPSAGSLSALEVNFGEPLDHQLIIDAIAVVDNNGQRVAGTSMTTEDDAVLHFTPSQNWETGDYTLQIESRLEDLAGNNLNRLFERDLSKDKGEAGNQEFYTRKFSVE